MPTAGVSASQAQWGSRADRRLAGDGCVRSRVKREGESPRGGGGGGCTQAWGFSLAPLTTQGPPPSHQEASVLSLLSAGQLPTQHRCAQAPRGARANTLGLSFYLDYLYKTLSPTAVPF